MSGTETCPKVSGVDSLPELPRPRFLEPRVRRMTGDGVGPVPLGIPYSGRWDTVDSESPWHERWWSGTRPLQCGFDRFRRL